VTEVLQARMRKHIITITETTEQDKRRIE